MYLIDGYKARAWNLDHIAEIYATNDGLTIQPAGDPDDVGRYSIYYKDRHHALEAFDELFRRIEYAKAHGMASVDLPIKGELP